MSLPVFLLIIASVSMSSFAQILLKHGMSSGGVQSALQNGGVMAFWVVLTNASIVSGLALYGLGALVWLKVLAKIEVSIAYPFVAIGFVLTMLLAVGFLGEKLVTQKIIGTLLIALGAVLVAKS